MFKFEKIKGALSGRRQFLATESPLNMMKNAVYFTSKAHFVIQVFRFLPWIFGHVEQMAWLERLG